MFCYCGGERTAQFGEFGQGKFLHSEALKVCVYLAVAQQPGCLTLMHVDLSHPNFSQMQTKD